MEILYGLIEDAGIEVNCRMGLSDKEHEEIRQTETMNLQISSTGQMALYYSDGTNALNGVSAGGLLRRDDERTRKLKGLFNE